MDWLPTATVNTLKQRALLLDNIRQFFRERGVLEVETPVLASTSVTDPFLRCFKTDLFDSAAQRLHPLYLQTSPEYAMKRLLAAGSGCIFQLCKAFRNEEQGRLHNPEFTMLEWYRVGYDHNALMREVEALLKLTLSVDTCEFQSYQRVFLDHVQLDPLEASCDELVGVLEKHHVDYYEQLVADKDGLLQLIFSVLIEPHIGQSVPIFIDYFPASQASLARLSEDDSRVAERFEVYFKGVELANGFHELTNEREQRRRFEVDNEYRVSLGYEPVAIDEKLLAALAYGLPNCAGVALGVDRLCMLKTGIDSIEQVLAFPISRA